MKTCSKCKVSKPKSEFSKQTANRENDGLRYSCKPCSNADNKAWVEANRENVAAYQSAWFKANRGKNAAYKRADRLKYPKRFALRKSTSYAVKTGKLIKLPCSVCGTEEGVHGHHEDYSQPLDVNWLCQKHHSERHVEIRA